MQLDNTIPAVVTGGASGLGAATARALAAKGVKVAILDLNAEAGEKIAGELGGVFSAALKGYAAELSKSAVNELREDPRVRYVVPDYEIKA